MAIETPRGPVAECLMERGFAVHSINPKQLDRFRDRHSPAGAKDDRRDARVLASALRMDPRCLRPPTATAAELAELREWSRLAEDLARERTRLANRMREQLWRYCPQFLAAVDGDLASAFALALWKRLPNPGAGRKARRSTLEKALRRHGVRRIDVETLRERLRAPSSPLAPGSAAAAAPLGWAGDSRPSTGQRGCSFAAWWKEVSREDGNFMIGMGDGRQSGRIDHRPASPLCRFRVHAGQARARVDNCDPLLGFRVLCAVRSHQDHIYARPEAHQDGPRGAVYIVAIFVLSVASLRYGWHPSTALRETARARCTPCEFTRVQF